MVQMVKNTLVVGLLVAVLLGVAGCSREQSDWEKAVVANTTDAYELFVKKYPTGTFTAQAQAHLKELYEQRDYQKARDTDTPEAYQGFLRQYPDGKFTEEARIRLENFTLAQTRSGAPADVEGPAGAAPPANASADAGAGAGAGSGPPAAIPPAPATATSQPSPAPEPSPSTAGSGAATSAAQGPVKPAGAPRSASKRPRGYTIQLGAFKSGKSAASAQWARLEKNYPSLLKGLSPRIRAAKTTGGKLFRLQVASLSRSRARSICRDLEAKSQPCIVLPLAAR
jgi:cell division protein FtsN